MNRRDVENIITEYVKPVYGFALKRCKTMEDAEDLSQEIIARAFRALLVKEEIADMGIMALLENGKLKEPTDGQKKAVSTMIVKG